MLLRTIGRLLKPPTLLAEHGSSVAPPDLSSLGSEFPPYRRTFAYPGDYVDEFHESIAGWPLEGELVKTKVPGFLRQADALALYELAFFAKGSVLEMGSAWGLSTTILCQAIKNSNRRAHLTSIEIAPEFQRATAEAVATLKLGRVYHALHGDARILGDHLIAQGRTFGFAFIDHDHAYEPTCVAARQLGSLLKPGGYALFHDFNDSRNRSEPDIYGVYRALIEILEDPAWEFLGMIGCCALVRRRSL